MSSIAFVHVQPELAVAVPDDVVVCGVVVGVVVVPLLPNASLPHIIRPVSAAAMVTANITIISVWAVSRQSS